MPLQLNRPPAFHRLQLAPPRFRTGRARPAKTLHAENRGLIEFGSEGVVADDCQLGRAEAPAEPLHCGNARLGRSLALIYGEFCIRRQRHHNCVMQLFCWYQLRLGPRSTLRRWSPGLETTSELKPITRPPSASRRWCQGLTTNPPTILATATVEAIRNNPRTPFLISHCTVKSCQTSGPPA